MSGSPNKSQLRLDPIYLDHNASTPPAQEVVEAMLPWLGVRHANPHAEHLAGRRAAAAIDEAIAQIAELIGAEFDDLILTSGATESNNLALQGLLLDDDRPFDLWHSAIEHKSVLEIARHVARSGVNVCELPVDSLGHCNLSTLRERGKSGRAVVSIMHANNEIGTVQDIGRIAAAVTELDGILHVDASQSCGRVAICVEEEGIDLLSLSSHKLYGPSGIGALFVSRRARKHLKPVMFGGGQQQGLRPGTVPVFLAVGFGAACSLARQRARSDAESIEAVATRFCEELASLGIRFHELGDPKRRLPGLRSLRIENVDGDDLMTRLAPFVSISTGSACASGELRASHVLRAIGLNEEQARSVIRVGFGRSSTIEEARTAAVRIASAIKR